MGRSRRSDSSRCLQKELVTCKLCRSAFWKIERWKRLRERSNDRRCERSKDCQIVKLWTDCYSDFYHHSVQLITDPPTGSHYKIDSSEANRSVFVSREASLKSRDSWGTKCLSNARKCAATATRRSRQRSAQPPLWVDWIAKIERMSESRMHEQTNLVELRTSICSLWLDNTIFYLLLVDVAAESGPFKILATSLSSRVNKFSEFKVHGKRDFVDYWAVA